MMIRLAAVLQVLGLSAVSFGLGSFDWRAGVIAAGASAVWSGLAIERAS